MHNARHEQAGHCGAQTAQRASKLAEALDAGAARGQGGSKELLWHKELLRAAAAAVQRLCESSSSSSWEVVSDSDWRARRGWLC